MKVNADLVRELRVAKSWTQEELALAAGLNLRTVQRIEKEGTASLQSKKALASVLEISVSDLDHEEPTGMSDKTTGSSTFGLLAMVVGFIAFAAVLGKFFVGPIDPPPPVEISVAKKAAEIRDATVAALKGEEYEAKSSARTRTVDDYLTYSFMALAGVAILLSIIGFVQHERLRPAIVGASLGGMAIAFQVAITIFVAVLVVFLLGAVLDKLDSDLFDF